MHTTQTDESTFKEGYYLDDGDGNYNVTSQEADWISGAIRSVVKKAYDGVVIFAMMEDHIEVYWRRDIDNNPVKIYEMWLYGRVYHNGDWIEQLFDFDIVGNPTEVELTVVEQHVKYWVLWTKVAFGGLTNYFGLEWTFTKDTDDQKFFLFSPEKEVEIKLHIDCRNAALKENRADDRGVGTPENADAEYVNTPTSGWTRYEYIFTRTGPCEAAGGRTPIQLFVQDAGISVK
jgi:hypothetical protein